MLPLLKSLIISELAPEGRLVTLVTFQKLLEPNGRSEDHDWPQLDPGNGRRPLEINDALSRVHVTGLLSPKGSLWVKI